MMCVYLCVCVGVAPFPGATTGTGGWINDVCVSVCVWLHFPGLLQVQAAGSIMRVCVGVAPFPGATTGTGGRIRDVQATGRGAHVIAGTAGYCFGNLHIPSNDSCCNFLFIAM